MEESQDQYARNLRSTLPQQRVLANTTQFIARLCFSLTLQRFETSPRGLIIDERTRAGRHSRKLAQLRKMHIPQHRVQISVEVFYCAEIGMTYRKLQKHIMQQILCLLRIVLDEPTCPRTQTRVALEKRLFVIWLSEESFEHVTFI